MANTTKTTNAAKAPEYPTIYGINKLYEAHKKAKRGKRGKSETIRYELNLARNLCKTAEQLRNGSYKPGKYSQFKIHEPKERLIQALHYNDRIVQHTLCDNILMPYLETRLIQDNVACRKGKGTHYGINRLSAHLRNHYRHHGTKGWCLKADVHKYFASIDHHTLKTMLAKERIDKQTLALIGKIIDSCNADTGKGLPIGNQTSQCFGLYYLDKIDRHIKEKQQIKHYVRYMDDMILIDADKTKLQKTLKEIKEIAENELQLSLNQKTQITPLKCGIDFLGWHFYLTETGKVIRKLRQTAKRRIFARLSKLQKDYAANKTDITAVNQSIASIKSHLKHGSTNKLLREILSRFVLSKTTKKSSDEQQSNAP